MKEGDELTFDVYGNTIKGTFIRHEGDLIRIKTTYDILENLGTEQSIHKSFLTKIK